jgi:hypothetical protein
MTEAEWLSRNNPTPMRTLLPGWISERKVRLFACACCRRIGELLANEARQWVEVAERYADGAASREVLNNTAATANAAVGDGTKFAINSDAFSAAVEVVVGGTLNDLTSILVAFAVAGERIKGEDTFLKFDDYYKEERAQHARLLYDSFRYPFGSAKAIRSALTADPSWLTSTVLALAEGIYQERAFDRMPILADALQDAGCDNEDILSHCRQPGEHVRGCWALDLVLGKA